MSRCPFTPSPRRRVRAIVVALVLLVAWTLAHLECTTTTEPAPMMLAVER